MNSCDSKSPERLSNGFAILRLLNSKATVNEIVMQIIPLVAQGWQYPEITYVRAMIRGQEFRSENYRTTPWRQTAEIFEEGKCIGFIEVGYLEERPALDEGPFSREERMLLESLARQIEKTIQERNTQNQPVQGESTQILAQKIGDAKTDVDHQFLAHMSHEIRTPMTAIMGFTDILLENVHEPTCIDAAITIKRNGCQLLNLINNLLDLSKLEAGKLPIEKVRCSPANLVADVTSIMRVRAQIDHLLLKTEFIGPIPETITTDPVRLRQILCNLVGNAIKFAKTGTIRIVTQLVQRENGPAVMQFDVIDDGVGMSHNQVEEIRRSFSQEGVSNQASRGTGLGLPITQRLAKLLGGDMTIVSELDKGTACSVTIDPGPLDHVAMFADSTEALVHRISRPASSANALPKLAGRILLVEDGPDNQRLIAFILRKAGAEVTIAENGQDAIDKILADEAVLGVDRPRCRTPFDVVLMDMQMPVLDGYSATRQLRAMGYSGPIIALTAHAMSHDRTKCLEAGCDDYLTKPVEQRQLLNTVAMFQIKSRTATTPRMESTASI
jgi:signal transduction histidine kinase/CheY-like chemotaxis protein